MRFQSVSRRRTQRVCRSPRLELLEDRVQPGSVLLWPAWLGDPVALSKPDETSLRNVVSSSRSLTDDSEPIAVPTSTEAPERGAEVRVVSVNPVPSRASRPADSHLSMDLLASVTASRGAQQKHLFSPPQLPPQGGGTGAATPVTFHNLHTGTQHVSDTTLELRSVPLQAIELNEQTGFTSQPTRFSVTHHYTAADLSADEMDNGDGGITAIRLWSRYVTGGTDSALGRAVTMDGAGNSYVTGWIDDAEGARSGFVAKQSSFGIPEYFTVFQSTDVDYEYANTTPNAIAVDGAGVAHVTGTALKLAWGDMDGFAVRLSADGAAILSGITYGFFYDDSSNGIAVDAVGRAVVTGTRETFSGQNLTFFGRLDADGMSWATQPHYYGLPTGYREMGGSAITLDSTGQSAFVAGWITPTLGDRDIVAARLNVETALPQYVVTGEHTGDDSFNAVGVDSSEHAYYGGSFGDEEGGTIGYLAKLVPAGDQAVYVYAFDDTQAVYGLSMDGQEVYFAGSSVGATLDAFVAKADSEGLATDGFFLEGDGDDIAYGVAFHNFVAVLAGVTTSTDIATDGSTLNAYSDAFVAATTLFA